MISPDLTPIIVAALATLAVLGVLIATFYSHIDRSSGGSKRLAAIAGSKGARERSGRTEEAKRADIEKTLRELEQKQRSTKGTRPSLLVRMRQAGLGWSTTTYAVMSLVTGAVAFVMVVGTSAIGRLPAAGFAVAVGLLGPHLYVTFLRNRRFHLFAKEFPNAIDVIVRGVKSGLPVGDCLRIISVEAQEPVRGEFREMVEDQTLGLPLDQAVQRLPERIPLAEAKFFAIVISLQSRTGGNLSDALGSLSRVLRERQKMRAKIRAMSTEAKTSAGIIAAMPVGVGTIMHFTSSEYVDVLFITFTGKMLLVGCALWMVLGVAVMWKMIRFDF